MAELIEHAAPLHDVGKIGIPDAVLLKPGKAHAKTNSTSSAGIANSANGSSTRCPATTAAPWPANHHGGKDHEHRRSPTLQMAARIAMTHHEKWDGTGYPRGLCAGEDPLGRPHHRGRRRVRRPEQRPPLQGGLSPGAMLRHDGGGAGARTSTRGCWTPSSPAASEILRVRLEYTETAAASAVVRSAAPARAWPRWLRADGPAITDPVVLGAASCHRARPTDRPGPRSSDCRPT